MIEKRISKDTTNKITLLILICFFLSGLTGLIYEILWTRMIVKIIGGAPFAVSIVLTVFMGSLGLGSFLASRTIDRIKEPIKLVKIYGVLELLIGAYGLAIPALLGAFKPLYAILYNQLFSYFVLYNLLTFVGCSILLCIPVICMGATLPILCRFYVTKLSHIGTHAGRLYGLNTVGAAFGALLCGFWLINLLGIRGTLIFAVSLNSIIGLACLLAGYKVTIRQTGLDQVGPEPKQYSDKDSAGRTELPEYPGAVSGALVVFAVSGFCAMAYEVIWTKLLGLIVGPTTYSFTIVLVTFILGLALGSMIFGWLADRTNKAIWLLVFTQIVAALFVLGTSQLMGNSQLFFAKLIFNFQHQFALLSVSKAVILFAFMILPTLCLGATFPLVGKICTQSVSKVGRSIGFAYAINTVGAVAGSFCAGFLLIPLIGKEKSLSLVIGLQLLTALVFAGIILSRKSKPILKWLPLTVPALVGLFLCFHFPKWNRYVLSEGKYYRLEEIKAQIKRPGWLEALLQGPEILTGYQCGELVYYGDGIGGFTTVLKSADPLGNIEYSMVNSGKTDASSRGDMATQTLLAHLPMLLHRGPKAVMVLGLASGITAGEVLHYPIDRLDIIDINKQVVAASEFFIPWNNNVLSNPKTNLIIQDGRAHLQLTTQKYDVIISEPSNPWMAGLATLFTRELFAAGKDRLNEDGIFVQWLHSYEMDWPTFALIGRTFAHVFPKGLLVSTEPSNTGGSDYLLVGFKGKKTLFGENIRQKLACVQQSRNVTLTDPKLLYRLLVSEDIQTLFGSGLINTDSRPRLEFAAPKLMYYNDPEIKKNIQSKKRFSTKTKNIMQELITDIDAQIDFAAYALSLYSPFSDMVDLSKATPLQKKRFYKLMETYCAANPLDYSILKNAELKERCRSIQLETIQARIGLMPNKASSYFYLADLYYANDMLDEAIDNYSRSLQINPDNADAHSNLGILLAQQGKLDQAVTHFTRSLLINPGNANVHNSLGILFTEQGKYEQAVAHFTRALRIKPDSATAYSSLGIVFARQSKFDEAIDNYSRSLQIKPDNAKAHNNVGILLAKRGKHSEAVRHFAEALRIKPDWVSPMNELAWIRATHKEAKFRDADEAVRLAERACELTNNRKPNMLDTLAASYAAADRFSDAVTTAEKALQLAQSSRQKQLTEQIRHRLSLYKAGQRYMEPSPKVSAD